MTIASEITALQNNLAAAKTAIETKGGTVGDTGLAGLATEIDTIPSGGGGNEVRFIDYDGTVITQMSIEEANALTEMPAFPVHEDLTGTGWTADLEQIQATTKPMDIGALYTNSNDPYQTIIKIYPSEGQNISLTINQWSANLISVDWGDGSASETFPNSGQSTLSHTYSNVQAKDCPYKIKLTPVGDTYKFYTLGNGQNYTFFGNSYATNYSLPFEIIFGEKVTIAQYAFSHCIGMRTMVLTKGIGYNNIQNYCFQYTTGLRACIMPCRPYNSYVFSYSGLTTAVLPQTDNQFTSIGQYYFQYSKLGYIVIPNTVTALGTNVFYNGNITNIVLPDSLKTISSFSLQNCKLQSITIPSALTNIGQNCFAGNLMKEITIPSLITSFNSGWCMNMQLNKVKFEKRDSMPTTSSIFLNPGNDYTAPMVVDFTDFTQVPPIESSCFGSNVPASTKFLVPAALEAQWKAAQNWSAYANNIVGV